MSSGSHSSPNRHSDASSSRRVRIGSVLLWLVGIGVVLPTEIHRWSLRDPHVGGVLGWLLPFSLDTTLFFPMLLAAPIFWWFRSVDTHPYGLLGQAAAFLEYQGPNTAGPKPNAIARTGIRRLVLLCLTVAITSLATSFWAGRPFDDLPPAYHDEYSYLFQAETFLAGKLSFPSSPVAPELFDQMHVLNEGRFASRYFPGTGLWLAPWVLIGHPVWGQWFAGMIIAVLVFGAGRELGGDGVGFFAGFLTGLAPGMAIFSNLLLAHHATLVGLSLFWFAFFRWRNRRHWSLAMLAGVGLTWAMLCRPMTAAGVCFPFGVAVVIWLIRGQTAIEDQADFRASASAHVGWMNRCGHVIAMGAPLLIGFALLFGYNLAITGSGWLTPYQLYTEVYTPRHVFGFNNVVRGTQALGDRVLPLVSRNYDNWPVNLTPQLAWENVGQRLLASWYWTLGLVPVALGLAMWILAGPRLWRTTWLLPASILSLHLAHLPYWYDGILHYHYVFESGPMWLLMFSLSLGFWLHLWREARRPGMKVWTGSLIAISLFVNYVPVDPFWTTRLEVETSNLLFARERYQRFAQLVEKRVTARPALVLVIPDRSDLHLDHVVNSPALNAPVLFGRLDEEAISPTEIARLFPDRHVYVYRAADQTIWYQPH